MFLWFLSAKVMIMKWGLWCLILSINSLKYPWMFLWFSWSKGIRIVQISFEDEFKGIMTIWLSGSRLKSSDWVLEVGLAIRVCGEGYTPIAGRLLNFLFFDCMAQQQERADPNHPAFGLIVWGISSPAWQIAYYGDDNARVILSTMATAALLQSTAWDIPLLKSFARQFATSGSMDISHQSHQYPNPAGLKIGCTVWPNLPIYEFCYISEFGKYIRTHSTINIPKIIVPAFYILTSFSKCIN